MRRTRWTNLASPQVREPLRAELGTGGAAPAELYIYDFIDCWGGEWGVSAADVVAALATVTGPALHLHLNSPGGDYFEGVAIYNALVRHNAQVTVFVDGMAASAASVIAMAGERVVMGQGSQMMIHEPSSFAGGTSADLRAAADMLDQTGDDIAGFYAQHAGGDPATWRDAMKIETWYTAQAAVAAGLADEVAAPPPRTAPTNSAPVLPAAVAPPAPVENAAPDAEPIVAPVVSTDEQPIVEQLADVFVIPDAFREELLALIAAHPRPAATQTPDAPAPDAPPATELPTAAAPDDTPVPPALPPINFAELIRSSVRKAIPA